MDYVNLGSTGLKVSRICFGTMTYGDPAWRNWVLPEDESRPFFKRALEHGINFFDTANSYGGGKSELSLGKALVSKRDRVVVATKFFNPMGPGPNDSGMSRVHIMQAVEASLQRLQMDYVDLYYIHHVDADGRTRAGRIDANRTDDGTAGRNHPRRNLFEG